MTQIDDTKPTIFTNISAAELIEQALSRGEGKLSHTGALTTTTGKRTGRSPADRFIVKEPSTADAIEWGSVNRPFEPEAFDKLWKLVDCRHSTRAVRRG